MEKEVKILISFGILFILPVVSAFLYLNFLKLKSRLIFGFGSGVILSVVFLRIVPESMEIATSELLATGMLIGVFVSVLLDKLNFLREEHITHEGLACWECENPFKGHVLFGLGLHYFFDGFFLGGLILSSEDNMIVFTLPVFIHKLIDGLILSLIFMGENTERKNIGKSMLFITAVSFSNVVGLVLAFFGLDIELIARFFSPVAAGILIYVAIHDFIPVLNTAFDFISFTAGIITTFLLLNVIH